MTHTEKLERIKAKCEQLLAIAEKRTNGKWTAINGDRYCAYPTVLRPGGPHFVLYDTTDEEAETAQADARFPGMDADAQFIAACAGPAESGWRATIAAVDSLADMGEHDAEILGANIIAAWPEELL